MPPIKGRMISRMGRMAQQSGGNYAHLKLSMSKKTTQAHILEAQMSLKVSGEVRDEKLMKLRYPPSIRQVLPSVKKFKGTKGFVDLTDDAHSDHSEDSDSSVEEKPLSQQILGIKKSTRGQVTSKYCVRSLTEQKFTGMIWDIAFSPVGDILVSCGEGILVCDYNLKVKSKLEHIILAGGISFLSDNKIVAVCRNTDTVNIFTPTGAFLRSFEAGFSPMAITATPDDRLIICDPGSKCVRIYNVEGEQMRSIGPEGNGFKLRWPLYTSVLDKDFFLVSDCHSQLILQFDMEGEFVIDKKMHTTVGNQVLRPHGVAVNECGDVFVVDMAIDTVEVFSSDDTFIQTLIPQDEGHSLRAKIVCLGGEDKKFLAIGGLAGIVKLYEFVPEEELKPQLTPIKTPTKAAKRLRGPKSRQQQFLKEEPKEIPDEVFEILDDDEEEEQNEDKVETASEKQVVQNNLVEDCDSDQLIINFNEESEDGMDFNGNNHDVHELDSNSRNTILTNEDDPVLVEDSDEEECVEDHDSNGKSNECLEVKENDLNFIMEQLSSDKPNGFENNENHEPLIVLDD